MKLLIPIKFSVLRNKYGATNALVSANIPVKLLCSIMDHVNGADNTSPVYELPKETVKLFVGDNISKLYLVFDGLDWHDGNKIMLFITDEADNVSHITNKFLATTNLIIEGETNGKKEE